MDGHAWLCVHAVNRKTHEPTIRRRRKGSLQYTHCFAPSALAFSMRVDPHEGGWTFGHILCIVAVGVLSPHLSATIWCTSPFGGTSRFQMKKGRKEEEKGKRRGGTILRCWLRYADCIQFLSLKLACNSMDICCGPLSVVQSKSERQACSAALVSTIKPDSQRQRRGRRSEKRSFRLRDTVPLRTCYRFRTQDAPQLLLPESARKRRRTTSASSRASRLLLALFNLAAETVRRASTVLTAVHSRRTSRLLDCVRACIVCFVTITHGPGSGS